jgi:hypothetical protein
LTVYDLNKSALAYVSTSEPLKGKGDYPLTRSTRSGGRHGGRKRGRGSGRESERERE